QAEDGIRDLTVTGVQTCALPIYLRGVVLRVDRFGNLITNFTPADLPGLFQEQPAGFKITIGKREISSLRQNYADGAPSDVFAIRSEERRVGKEGRCGWWV